jgi:hypothetical protein
MFVCYVIRSLPWWSIRYFFGHLIINLRGCIQKFPDSRLERVLQIVQLPATRCSFIAILWVSLVSFTAIIRCVASQRVILKVSIYLFIDSILKLLWMFQKLPRTLLSGHLALHATTVGLRWAGLTFLIGSANEITLNYEFRMMLWIGVGKQTYETVLRTQTAK